MFPSEIRTGFDVDAHCARDKTQTFIRSCVIAPEKKNDLIGACALEVLSTNYFEISENWKNVGWVLDKPVFYRTGVVRLEGGRMLGEYGWCAALIKLSKE